MTTGREANKQVINEWTSKKSWLWSINAQMGIKGSFTYFFDFFIVKLGGYKNLTRRIVNAEDSFLVTASYFILNRRCCGGWKEENKCDKLWWWWYVEKRYQDINVDDDDDDDKRKRKFRSHENARKFHLEWTLTRADNLCMHCVHMKRVHQRSHCVAQ